MRSLILLFAILVVVPAKAQSLEYEALQAQISRDFGIAPKSMKITIEIEGDVGEPFKTVTPDVEIKRARFSSVVSDQVASPIAKLPVMTFTSPVRTRARVYTAPVVTRYYAAPVVTRSYSVQQPTYYQSYPTNTNRSWSMGLGGLFGASSTRTFVNGGG